MSDIERFVENYNDELNSTELYNVLAKVEKQEKLAEVYRRLAVTEQKHADVWAKKIREAGGTVPAFKLTWRTRTLIWLAQRFGAHTVLPTMTAFEQDHSRDYAAHGDAGDIPADEQSHARVLQQLSNAPSGMEGGAIAKLEGRHRTPGGNALRAAVLGASDGLLSNMSLVMGVVGAEVGSRNILLTGFAGLLAGAFSMALGEWLSVQSSRELFEKQIRLEKEEIEMAPEEEIEELALIYQARGVEKNTAEQMASQIIHKGTSALDTLAREELGVDPEELGGSAWEAAIASFLMFAGGAIIPVIPHIFLDGTIATVVSLAFSAVGLFAIGASITLFTGRSIFYSGMRQVIFGLIAAAITFGIGRLFGVAVGG